MAGAGAGRQALARWGEEAVARHLASLEGCTILCRNYRCALGELDIVAREGDTVVFVEVKARRGAAFGLPQEAVNGPKQARLRRLALHFLQRHGLGEAPCRFDVATVRPGPAAGAVVELIRGAFS